MEFTWDIPENDNIEDDKTDDREENVEYSVEPKTVDVDIPVINPGTWESKSIILFKEVPEIIWCCLFLLVRTSGHRQSCIEVSLVFCWEWNERKNE